MKKSILIYILFFINISVFANKATGTIYGAVIDAALLDPIPYATIIVIDSNGKVLFGSTSSDDGTFSIEKIPMGNYTVQVQFMGYKTFSKIIQITDKNPNYNFELIKLEEDIAMLDSVTVVAERSTIEQRIDRKVINIGKDLTTVGASASEIMNNIPSVSVDQDGNISLRGNENVRILIDGKPTNMDAAQLLKQIPSTSIKSIELITNPSAKYNPEGMSGIINIILHKNANDGFNGNLTLGLTASEYIRSNGSIDLNYRKKRFNFYGNLGGQIGDRYNMGRINFTENDYKQNFDIFNFENSYLYKVGVDFFMDDDNTFSFYTNQNRYHADTDGAVDVIYPNDPQNDISQNLDLGNTNMNSTYNLAIDHKFNGDGHKIIIEADYNTLYKDEDSNFSFEGNTTGLESYHDLVSEKRKNFIGNIDYENPLNTNSKLEIGAEARLMDTDNVYNTNSEIFSNSTYQYERDIYSFYSTFGQNLEKWSYQLGARLENFKVKAVYNDKRVYSDENINVYPSGFLNYTPSEINSYQFSFSRRVDRPSFGQVNPIRNVSTPRLTVTGNPELESQFTNSLEFNYTRKFGKKGSLTAGIFYRKINDEINQVFLEDPNEEGSLLLQYDNFEDNNSYGLELNINYKLTGWWSTNTSFDVYSQKLKGIVGLSYLETNNTAWTFKTNHSFKATDQLTFQLFGFYMSESKSLQFDMDSMFFMNFGARYSLLDDAATISINFNDVFNTREFIYSNGRPLAQEGRFKGDSQNVYLGISYRFGGGKAKNINRKRRDSEEIQGGGIF